MVKHVYSRVKESRFEWQFVDKQMMKDTVLRLVPSDSGDDRTDGDFPSPLLLVRL